MRNWSYVFAVAALVVLAVIYWGGAIVVRDAPIFHHLDEKLGTSFFMGSHNRLMSLFRRAQKSDEPDPFTRPYHDFDKVLKQTSE